MLSKDRITWCHLFVYFFLKILMSECNTLKAALTVCTLFGWLLCCPLSEKALELPFICSRMHGFSYIKINSIVEPYLLWAFQVLTLSLNYYPCLVVLCSPSKFPTSCVMKTQSYIIYLKIPKRSLWSLFLLPGVQPTQLDYLFIHHLFSVNPSSAPTSVIPVHRCAVYGFSFMWPSGLFIVICGFVKMGTLATLPFFFFDF